MQYYISEQADRDLQEIWAHIAADNEPAATRTIRHIISRFRLLTQHPLLGRSRDELKAGYRSLAVGEYVIFYQVEETQVRICHVLHGRRDLQVFEFE